MFTFTKSLLFIAAMAATLSPAYAQKAKAAKGTVGGAGGNSEGLRDNLPSTGTPPINGTGITLRPPELRDNPMATLFVSTAGNLKLELSVTALKCEINEDGSVVRNSCLREFSGSTNSAITVLPGYYLISASMLTGSGKSTIYSEKPIHINAGRITSIAMKPVTVAATDRLKSVQLGIDYGDSNEFKKLMHYYWGRSDAEASGFLSRLNFSCQNTTRDHNGSLKCGIDNYIEQPLRKIIDAHCVGNKVEQQAAEFELQNGHLQHQVLYQGALEILAAVKKEFAENRELQAHCSQPRITPEFLSRFSITRVRDERIHYAKGDSEFFKAKRQAPSLKIVRDTTTKIVTISATESVTDLGYDSGLFYKLSPTSIPYNRDRKDTTPAYVFPGTYYVVYDFVGNWDNVEKTLVQTQYGQIVE